jgi:hypothetical protein
VIFAAFSSLAVRKPYEIYSRDDAEGDERGASEGNQDSNVSHFVESLLERTELMSTRTIQSELVVAEEVWNQRVFKYVFLSLRNLYN